MNFIKRFFGNLPAVFVPSNAIFHPEFEFVLDACGLKYLYATTLMRYPEGGRLKKILRIAGTKGPGNLRYYTRNCAFEPTYEHYRGINFTLKQIEAAFTWSKPAIISTHRVNYVGGIDPDNRSKGLKELHSLLKAIVKKWPEIEFMSSRDAYSAILNKN